MNPTPQQQAAINGLISLGYNQQQATQMVMGQQQSPSPFGQQQQVSLSPMQQILQALLAPSVIGSLQAPYNLQMQAANIGMNPAALTSRINQATRQLSPELIHSVTRATTPSIASRGLATSPGMSQQIIAEALAPYQIQEQQMAANTVMGGMQLPFGVGAGLAGQYPESLVNLANVLGYGH